MRSPLRGWTLLVLVLLPHLMACAVHRDPPRTTPRYGVNRVKLPAGLAPGDRVEILFEDDHAVSARVVDWSGSDIVVDHDGRRCIYPWHQIAAVLEPRRAEPKRAPSPLGAMGRFFLTIGIVALMASGVN